MKNINLAIIVSVLLIPTLVQAAFEHESVLEADIDGPILDVATNPAEDMVFVLTPGAVLIYSTSEQAILERIPVEKPYDRIAYQDPDRLVLTAGEPSRINVIRYSRIYDIDVSGRAVKGPVDAKVTLVVFDDYQ